MNPELLKAIIQGGLGIAITAILWDFGNTYLDNEHEKAMANIQSEIRVIEALELMSAATTNQAGSNVRMAEAFEGLVEIYSGDGK